MRTLVVNFKNYSRVLGRGSVDLATEAERFSTKALSVIVAPPTPMISLVVSSTKVQVFSQGVGKEVGEKTTGATTPESLKGAGASGVILNHSESRRPESEIGALVPRLQALGLKTCLCVQTAAEVRKYARVGPEFLAVEPPELIGSGVAISRARPELISESVRAARLARFQGLVLAGAGIVSGEDAALAVKLGADGVLVSSSIVGAKDWRRKLSDFARSLD